MRSTIAITLAVAAVAVSAQDCNPSYNVAGSGECFTNCNINAGNTFMSGWTMDHTSPKFLDSLKLMCTKGTPEYTAFMTKAGMCMAGCKDDPELFNSEFAGACGWYATHKNDQCGATAATTTNPPASNTPPAPAATTTTTTAAGTTAATSASASAGSNSAAASSASAASGASGASSAAPAASSNGAAGSSVAGSNGAAGSSAAASAKPSQPANAANKLQLSGYAIALAAGAGYLAL